MSSIPAPTPALILPSKRRKALLKFGLPALCLAAALAYYGPRALNTGPKAFGGTFTSIQRTDLDVKVSKDGDLQAVNNVDVISTVEGQNTIQVLAKEGAFVKKGDLLVKLDSSTIEQRIEDTTLDVQKAEADLATANELKLIQESQNAANMEAAEVALQLARIDLQQYTEGTYPQSLVNAQTDLDMAQVSLKNKQEDFDQTQKLYEKGFVTAADVKRAELDVRNAQVSLRKAQTALDVLTQYTNAMNLATKKNTVVQSEAKLLRVQRENSAAMNQQNTGVKAKEETLNSQRRRLKKLQDQLAGCTITAPTDGLVVYASTIDRWSNTQIQEGAMIRERQLILRLPDTSQMKAVIRVPEAQVAKLQPGQRAEVKVVGLPKTFEATLSKISVLSDSSSRWNNPDVKEYPVDLNFDETPPQLKPGMGVMADLYIDRLKDVVTVPLTSIYAAGRDTYVFVKSGVGVVPAKVRLGKVNETHAQIEEGATAGQQVLVLEAGQGRELLEKAGIKIEQAQPTSRPSGKGNRRGGGDGGSGRPAKEAPKGA